MPTFNDLKEAKEYFTNDRFATLNGMKLDELDESHSLCSLVLDDRHKNANGGIMGGVLFTLADFAFAALVNNIHRPTVAQQVSINFLNAPKGKTLFAKAEIIKNGKTTSVVSVSVYDDLSRDVALFTGTGYKLFT